jgi:protein-S-isoprenylcysteine O-methyltransferase Ste14
MAHRIVFIALFCLLTGLRFYYKLKAGLFKEPLFSRQESAAFIVYRAVLGIPLLAATIQYCFLPGRLPFSYVSFPGWARILGAAAGGLALFLLQWVHRVLGVNFSTSIFVRPGHRMVVSGPYRWVRHPMYLAYLTLFLSAFLISGNWIIGVSGAAIIGMLMTVRLKREEAILVQRFGRSYLSYSRTTGRFLPWRAWRSAASRRAETAKTAAELEACGAEADAPVREPGQPPRSSG